jgi:hypothetical protein
MNDLERRRPATWPQAPGSQDGVSQVERRLDGFNTEMSKMKGLYLISDYQTNPLIEGSVHLAEQAARRILEQA